MRVPWLRVESEQTREADDRTSSAPVLGPRDRQLIASAASERSRLRVRWPTGRPQPQRGSRARGLVTLFVTLDFLPKRRVSTEVPEGAVWPPPRGIVIMTGVRDDDELGILTGMVENEPKGAACDGYAGGGRLKHSLLGEPPSTGFVAGDWIGDSEIVDELLEPPRRRGEKAGEGAIW